MHRIYYTNDLGITLAWPCMLTVRFNLEGEFSTVDTAELVMGMLFAGNYHPLHHHDRSPPSTTTIPSWRSNIYIYI